MPIRTLIVDDEPLARERLRTLLADEADIEIVGECGDGRRAVAAIRKHRPDLVFLDVQMPELDGFGVLRAVGAQNLPTVVFVTAYDKYALKAFEVHALDYLLKPFDRDRFDRALDRARRELRRGTGELNERVLHLLEEAGAKPRFLERLVVKTAGRVYFLRAEEIDWFEAAGNYVKLHAGKDEHLIRETMANLEDQLNPKKFVRIHRSTIVQIERIKELQPWFHGDYVVLLRDGTKLTLSRSYRDRLENLLGKSL